MTKEEVYDKQIFPLMAQVIEICKEHKIANLCSFSLDPDEGLACTTALLAPEYDPPPEFVQALEVIRPPERSTLNMTITKADGSKEIHTIL